MKLMIASDLHGSAFYVEKLLSAMEQEQPDKLILLGDLLYHGPRNDLPEGYAPKKVIEMLTGIQNRVLSIRGNCEAEVDQMVLPFPVLNDYGVLFVDGITMYLIHGHKNMDFPVQQGNVVLSGHTHVPVLEEKQGIFYGNPGSVSIPKRKSVHGYLIYENGVLYHRGLTQGDLLPPLHIFKNV